MLGERKALNFCQGLLALYLVLLVLFTKTINLEVVALALTIFLSGWLIFRSGLKRNEYYYFFFLDGTMILQFLLLWGVGFV
ncbi:MAG: hypothetical protein REI93_06650, partial [Pedobacter sp.]|nr:hypothetical protein [Pedobacter sp.]